MDELQISLDRLTELEKLLSSPENLTNHTTSLTLRQEHARLLPLRQLSEKRKSYLQQLQAAQELTRELDIATLAQEEITELTAQLHSVEQKIHSLLIPAHPDDDKKTIMEIRAGTGGDEAALFVSDCVRMYTLYATRQKWQLQTLSATGAPLGGYREYIMSLAGAQVHRFLHLEAGTHRVQRVPVTETQGRLHTSAITIAILLEPTAEEEKINDSELRIDTYRASGAGGQHVNTTDSAVRITHLPTQIVVHCQQERSQHKNKEKALSLLRARIANHRRQQEIAARAQLRSSQVGSGDRSNRIRTYNFPQNRCTDHRIPLTLHNLDKILDGHLDELSSALLKWSR